MLNVPESSSIRQLVIRSWVSRVFRSDLLILSTSPLDSIKCTVAEITHPYPYPYCNKTKSVFYLYGQLKNTSCVPQNKSNIHVLNYKNALHDLSVPAQLAHAATVQLD